MTKVENLLRGHYVGITLQGRSVYQHPSIHGKLIYSTGEGLEKGQRWYKKNQQMHNRFAATRQNRRNHLTLMGYAADGDLPVLTDGIDIHVYNDREKKWKDSIESLHQFRFHNQPKRTHEMSPYSPSVSSSPSPRTPSVSSSHRPIVRFSSQYVHITELGSDRKGVVYKMCKHIDGQWVCKEVYENGSPV